MKKIPPLIIGFIALLHAAFASAQSSEWEKVVEAGRREQEQLIGSAPSYVPSES